MPDRNRSALRFGRSATRPLAADKVMVIGLGRFGSALSQELMVLGSEVLGVDVNHRRVQDHAESLTHVVEADSTDLAVLRQLGAADYEVAVVSIGNDIEASILTTAGLSELGVTNIWAKAISDSHRRILERIGAHHVVLPEHDMGQRVAHLVSGGVLNWFQLDEQFAMVETSVPAELVGKSLAEAGIRARYGVTVVTVKPANGHFTYATADTVLADGDILVVAGEWSEAEAFAHLN